MASDRKIHWGIMSPSATKMKINFVVALMASHGYVKDGASLEFVHATHHNEKPDSTKKRNRQAVWPSEENLEIAPEIGYGHFLDE
ncbi:hypothetical protein BDV30DRAFT_219586 [Aspergillus minisclerotigenes]|uniref:Uncharacterized protein n=1 Tax=Aspergillus minisclerotigenes TaxID=656917 RepID=A0A5N6ILZ3_9EURO|nr:hypothetical protein BDV30DRAFT_219586 [Aspergillus minisclerotigenes]